MVRYLPFRPSYRKFWSEVQYGSGDLGHLPWVGGYEGFFPGEVIPDPLDEAIVEVLLYDIEGKGWAALASLPGEDPDRRPGG